MNIIKNLFRSLAKLISKENFKKCYTGTRDYVLSLTFVKVTAIIVVNCFLLTCVYGQGVAAVIDNGRTATQFKQIFDDFTLPYSYGKITSANFTGSDTVVINIQDLHSHPEVQRNINNIISLFDEKYGVKNVYLEGAYGQVSTKWLTVAKDETVKKSVMDKLIDAGRLTGAEYFSASKNKTEIIKGLENKDEYFDNLKRFGQIIDNQNIINLHLDEINNTVKDLQAKYYNRQQQKIEELSAQYTSGDIDAKKYFTLMKKHADKLGVDIDSYQNLSLYITLLEKQKEINYSKTTQELQVLVAKLKEVLPYGAYKMLLEQTKNFAQMDKLYGYIIKLSKQYNFDLSANFPELEKFFAYIELSQKINPLELVKEEQDFKDEINDRFSVNKAEEEVVFLSSFVRYYRDYLTGKITADDCKYYNANIDRFKYVWVKYIDNKEVVALQDYETISDKFYKINFSRNNYFVENMKDVLDGKKMSGEVTGTDELQKTMNSLQNAKEVYITVTGGFHTQGLSELLTKAGITNIVITPNVTGDTKVAEETYYKIAQEQAKISFQALASLNASQAILAGDRGAIGDILKAVLESDKKITEDNINELFDQMIGQSSSVTSMKYEKGSNSISVTVKGKRYYYDVEKDEWQGTEGVNEVQPKSLGSISSTLNIVEKVAALSSAAAVVTTLYIFTPVIAPFLPAVAIISILASIFGWSSVALKSYEQSQLEIAKAKSLESDESDKDFENRLENKLRDLGFKESDIKNLNLKGMYSGSDKEGYDEEFAFGYRNKTAGTIHLNRSTINSLFMDVAQFKDDRLSNALFSMFVSHELRHKKHPSWSETFVGALDIFSFISAYIRGLLRGPVSSNEYIEGISAEDLSVEEQKEYKKAVEILGEDLVEKFKERQADAYAKGETDAQIEKAKKQIRESNQTKRQIIMAAKLVEGKDLVELGTGAGKDDAFALAQVYQYKNGKYTLYSSNTAPLSYRFVNKSLTMMEDLYKKGYITEEELKNNPYMVSYVHESVDSLSEQWELTIENGVIKRNVNKDLSREDLYNSQLVIGSSVAEFVWSAERELDGETTISKHDWNVMIDEVHKVLEQGADDTYTISGTDRSDASIEAKKQEYAHKIVREQLREGTHFNIKDKKVEIIKGKENEICEIYRNTSNDFANLDNDSILKYVQNSLEAAHYFREGKDYIVFEEETPLTREESIMLYFVTDRVFNNEGKGITLGEYKNYATSNSAINNIELENITQKTLDNVKEEIENLKNKGYEREKVIEEANENLKKKNLKYHVKLKDTLTTETTSKSMDGTKHYALELVAAEKYKDKSFNYTYLKNSGSSMDIATFMSLDKIKTFTGASGTINSDLIKEVYNKNVLELGSEGGAVSSELFKTITSNREEQNNKYSNVHSSLNAMGNNMRLVKVNDSIQAKQLENMIDGPTCVIIDDGKDLKSIEIKENGKTIKKIDGISNSDEALEYLAFYPNITVISTALIATGVDPKPLSAKVLDYSEDYYKENGKIKDGYIEVELTEDKSIIEVITDEDLKDVVKNGKKIVLKGRTKQDLLNEGQLVDVLVGVNLSWDIDGKIEEQFRARVGRSNTKGIYISILNIEDIDEDEMTQEDVAILKEQVEKIEAIEGIENDEERAKIMLQATFDNVGVEPNEREIAFAQAMMGMQGNMVNVSDISDDGTISKYGKYRSASRKVVEAIDRIRRNDAQRKISSIKSKQRQTAEEWDFVKTQKEIIKDLSNPEQFFENNGTDIKTVISNLNTNSNLRKQFAGSLKKFGFNHESEMYKLIEKLESDEEITKEDINTFFKFAEAYYKAMYVNVWNRTNDSKRNAIFAFQNGFNQVLFQTASLDQESEDIRVFSEITYGFEEKMFDLLGLSLFVPNVGKSEFKSIYKVFGVLGQSINYIVMGFFGLGFAGISAYMIGIATTSIVLSPLMLGIAAVAFLFIIMLVALKPLTNKINADLQDKGINNSLRKLANTGNSKYLKDAMVSIFTKSFFSIFQINLVVSIGMIGLGIIFGVPALISLAFVSSLIAVVGALALIVSSSKYSPSSNKDENLNETKFDKVKRVLKEFSIRRTIKEIRTYIPAVAKRKTVSNVTQTKANNITNMAILGISLVALVSIFTTVSLPFLIAGVALVGMLLFAQYGVPSLIYKDKESLSSQTNLRTSVLTLGSIVGSFVLVGMGIINISIISAFLGAMIPAIVLIGIFGVYQYYKTLNFIDEPLAQNKSRMDKVKSLLKTSIPVVSIALFIIGGFILKGAAVSIFAIISPIAIGVGITLAAIFIILLYNEKTRPYAQLLLTLIGFAAMFSGKSEQVANIVQQTGTTLEDAFLPGVVSAAPVNGTETAKESVSETEKVKVPATEEKEDSSVKKQDENEDETKKDINVLTAEQKNATDTNITGAAQPAINGTEEISVPAEDKKEEAVTSSEKAEVQDSSTKKEEIPSEIKDIMKNLDPQGKVTSGWDAKFVQNNFLNEDGSLKSNYKDLVKQMINKDLNTYKQDPANIVRDNLPKGFNVEGKKDGNSYYLEITDKKGHKYRVDPYDEHGNYKGDAKVIKLSKNISTNLTSLEKEGYKVNYKDGTYTIGKGKGKNAVSMDFKADADGMINKKSSTEVLDSKYKLSTTRNGSYKVEEKYEGKNNDIYFEVSDNKGHSMRIYPYKENGDYVKDPAKIANKTFDEWNKLEKSGKGYKVVSASNGKLLIRTTDKETFEIDIFNKSYNAKDVSRIYNKYSELINEGHKVEIKYDSNKYIYYVIDGKVYYPFGPDGEWNDNFFTDGGNSGGGNVWGNYFNYVGGGSGGNQGYVTQLDIVGLDPVDISEWQKNAKHSDAIETEKRISWLPESLSFISDFINHFYEGIRNMIYFFQTLIFGNEQLVKDNTGIGFPSLLERMSIDVNSMSDEEIAEMESYDMPKENFENLKGYDESGNETTDTNKIVEYRNDNVIWKQEEDGNGDEMWKCYENNDGQTGAELMMLQKVQVEKDNPEKQYAFTDLKNIRLNASTGPDAVSHQYTELVPIAYADIAGTTMSFQSYGSDTVGNGLDAKFIDPGTSIPTRAAMLDLVSGDFIYDSHTYSAVIVEFASDPYLRDLITNNCEDFNSENPFCPGGKVDKRSLDFIKTFLTTVKCDNKGNPYIYVMINGKKTPCPLLRSEGDKLVVLNEETNEEFTINKNESLGYVLEPSDITKQAGSPNHTAINQLKTLLVLYNSLNNEDIEHINTIYPTINYEKNDWTRMNINPKEKGLSSDNIRQMYQFLYQSNRSGNGNVFLGVDAISGIDSADMTPGKISEVANMMHGRINDEYSFVKSMVDYKIDFGIVSVPGTDLLELANIRIPSDIFKKGSDSIISNDSWNTIREQGLTEKGENSWVYGKDFTAGSFYDLLFRDTGPNKFINEHTHSAVIAFGGYFYLFVAAIIGYRTLKGIVNGFKKVKKFILNKTRREPPADPNEVVETDIYSSIDLMQLKGKTAKEQIEYMKGDKKGNKNYVEVYNKIAEFVGPENMDAVIEQIEESTKDIKFEQEIGKQIKRKLRNAIKNAQFEKLNAGIENYKKSVTDLEGKRQAHAINVAKINPNAKKYIDNVPGLIEKDSHVQLLRRMIKTGLITFDDLEKAFSEVEEEYYKNGKKIKDTLDGDSGPMDKVVKVLLKKTVEYQYDEIVDYLPKAIKEDEDIKDNILKLSNRLYHQLLDNPELIEENGNIVNGANENVAQQMSQQNLREMIVANILMLKPSLTETKSFGSDTQTSTLNITRAILNDIDKVKKIERKIERKQQDLERKVQELDSIRDIAGVSAQQERQELRNDINKLNADIDKLKEESEQLKNKPEQRIDEFITFTEHFVESNLLFKPLSTEPGDPTNIDWLRQVEENNFYTDTSHILLFMLLATDQIIKDVDGNEINIKDIDIFNLTEEDLTREYEVKGEKVTLFGNILDVMAKDKKTNEKLRERLDNGESINLIAEINDYLNDDIYKDDENLKKDRYTDFGRTINKDIANIHRIVEGDSELSRYEKFATIEQEKAIDRAINGRTIRGVKVGNNSIFDNCHIDVDDYVSFNNSNLFSLLNEAGVLSAGMVSKGLDLGEVMRDYIIDGDPDLQTKRTRLANLRTALQNDLNNNKAGGIITNRDSARDMINSLENLETNYGQTFFIRALNGISVYRRYLKDILGFKFWNIETRKQRIATFALMGVFASLIAVVFLFATPTGAFFIPMIVGTLSKSVIGNMILSSLTSISGLAASVVGPTWMSVISTITNMASHDIIMTLFVSGLLLPKMIVGRATDGNMKKNILGITSAFSVYYGGFLGGFFIRGISISLFPGVFPVFALLTIGISFAVWLFIGIPTFASFWHIMIATKANKIEQAKSKILKAHSDMEKRISWQKRSLLSFGIGAVAGIGWLTSLLFSFATFIAPPFMFGTLIVVSTFIIASIIMAAWSYRYPGNIDNDKTFGKLFVRDSYEILMQKLESDDNPEMFMSETRANIETAFEKFLINEKEREAMMKALDIIEEGVINGKSGKDIEKDIDEKIGGLEKLAPYKAETRNLFKQFFTDCAIEKAPIPDWSKIPPFAEHTQAYSEVAIWTRANILSEGNFHKGTSQFAYVASKFKKSYWANACDRIDLIVKNSELSGDDKKRLMRFANYLRNIEETSEIKTAKELGLSGEAEVVYNEILGVACDFMEVILGSQETVLKSKYDNHLEVYKTLALSQGDLRYAKILNIVRSEYDTIEEALDKGCNKLINNKLPERQITKDDVEYFREKTKLYKPEVEEKHKMVITDFSLYKKADIIEASRDYRKELSSDDAKLSDDEFNNRKEEIIEQQEKERLSGFSSKNELKDIISNIEKEVLENVKNENDGNYVKNIEAEIDKKLGYHAQHLEKGSDTVIKELVVKRIAFRALDRHSISLLVLGDKYDVKINYVDISDETALRGNKNAQLRTSLPEFFGYDIVIERDALVSNALGQSMFCVNAVVDFNQNKYLCTNLPMQTKGSGLVTDNGSPLFPIGYSYSGAIRDWTQGTQSAYGSLLTYYGKGIMRAEGIIAIGWTNPGEDSNSIYILFKAFSMGQQKIDDVAGQAHAGYLPYFRLDWIRPTTTNVVGSEARYSSNVFRMLYDPFSTIYEKTNSMGYDWKLSNVMMAAHYVNSILTVIFALFLPLAVIFSSFAFLMPFILSFAVSTVLMLAINLTKINAEARQKGDFFAALKGSLRDLIDYFPFWVAMQPVMALFGINASNGVYKFLNTYKDMKLQQDRDIKGVYKFVGSVGSNIGAIGYIFTGLYLLLIVAFTLSNPIAFGFGMGMLKAVLGIAGAIVVSFFYILANNSFVNGLNSYNVKLDENGNIVGNQIGKTVYIPALKSIFTSIILLYRYFRDLFLILKNEEPKYVERMEKSLREKETVIENTDIWLKIISDILNKDERTPAEQKIVERLVEKYKAEENLRNGQEINSEEDLKEYIDEVKDKTFVLTPADEKLKEIKEKIDKGIANLEIDVSVRKNGNLTLDDIQNILEDPKNSEEQELVEFLTSEKSAEDIIKEIKEAKKNSRRNIVKRSYDKVNNVAHITDREKSPAGKEMERIAGFVQELIIEDVKVEQDGNVITISEDGKLIKKDKDGNVIKNAVLTKEEKDELSNQLKPYKEALDIDIRSSFEYNLFRGYTNFLEISKNFLYKHPVIKAIIRPVVTGVAVAGLFSVISTAVMSFTAFSSTVAPMMVLVFLTVAVLWSLYNLGSALAKENGSSYLKIFSFATWAGIPAIAFYIFGVSLPVSASILAIFTVFLGVGYLVQKRNIKNTKKEFETKINEIAQVEGENSLQKLVEKRIENGEYTQEEIEKDFDRIVREVFDEVLVEELAFRFGADEKKSVDELREEYYDMPEKEFSERQKKQSFIDEKINPYLSQIYNDIETASDARISFFLQQTFTTLGGEQDKSGNFVKTGIANDVINEVKRTFGKKTESKKDDNIDNNDNKDDDNKKSEGNDNNGNTNQQSVSEQESQLALPAGDRPIPVEYQLPAGSQPLALPAGSQPSGTNQAETVSEINKAIDNLKDSDFDKDEDIQDKKEKYKKIVEQLDIVQQETGVNQFEGFYYQKGSHKGELITGEMLKGLLDTILDKNTGTTLNQEGKVEPRKLSGYIIDYGVLKEEEPSMPSAVKDPGETVNVNGEKVSKDVSGLKEYSEFSTDNEESILKQMIGIVPAYIAGGMGERLGFLGIKLEMQESNLFKNSFFNRYIKYFDGIADRINEKLGIKLKQAMFIMVSGETRDGTINMLKNDYGFEYIKTTDKGLEIYEIPSKEKKYGVTRVYIATQPLEPAIKEGKLSIKQEYDEHGDLKDVYVEGKPGGHGAVYDVYNETDFLNEVEKFYKEQEDIQKFCEKEGVDIKNIISVLHAQDTTSAALPANEMIAYYMKDNKGVFTGTAREQGEKVGAFITRKDIDEIKSELYRLDDPNANENEIKQNVEKRIVSVIEYNIIAKLPEDIFTAGSINHFALDAQTLKGTIASIVLNEIVNEKPGKSSRIEKVMQDIIEEIPMEDIQIINVEQRRALFSPAKNGLAVKNTASIKEEKNDVEKKKLQELANAKGNGIREVKVKNEVYVVVNVSDDRDVVEYYEFVDSLKDTLVSSEYDSYANGEEMLQNAGFTIIGEKEKIDVFGNKVLVNGQKVDEVGARVVIDGYGTLAALDERTVGNDNTLTTRSSLYLDGNVGFDAAHIDGDVRIHAGQGVKVTLTGEFYNEGSKFEHMTKVDYVKIIEKETKQKAEKKGKYVVSEELQQAIRGGHYNVKESFELSLTDSGNYIVKATDDGKTITVYKIVDGKNIEYEKYQLKDNKYIKIPIQTRKYGPYSVEVQNAQNEVKRSYIWNIPLRIVKFIIKNLSGNEVSIEFESLEESRKAGYTKIMAVPGIFVSEKDIERIKDNENFSEDEDGNYILKDEDGNVIAKVEDGKLLNKEGKQIEFKFNANVKAEGDTINILFNINSGDYRDHRREIFDSLDNETKQHLIKTAQLSLYDTLVSDPVVENKMTRLFTGNKWTIANIDQSSIDKLNMKFEKDIKALKKELSSVYSIAEMDSIINKSTNGIMSVQRQETYLTITPSTDIAAILNTLRNSGVTTIILKGSYDSDAIKFIKNHGFDVVIQVDISNVDNRLDNYIEQGGASGVRFVVEKTDNIEQTISETRNIINSLNFRTIPMISYDFAPNVLNENQDEIFDYFGKENNDAELVVDAETCLNNLDNEKFKVLVNNAKLVVRVKSINSSISEKILSIFSGVAICAKRTYVRTNKFKNSLMNNPRYQGRDVELNDILVKGKSISDLKDFLEGKELTEAEMNKLFTFTDSTIKYLKEVAENSGRSLDAVTREYVLGSMMAYVETEIVPNDVKLGEKNYKIFVGAALLMLVDGESADSIKQKIEEVDISGDKTMSQFLNEEPIAKDILNMWKFEDMVIKLDKPMNEEAKMTMSELMKVILAMDTMLPETDFAEISTASIDGINGILAAA